MGSIKKSPTGLSNLSHLPQKTAGELAPMRFRRLPGVTGPCPSTTLDKSFIYFASHFTGKAAACQAPNAHRRQFPQIAQKPPRKMRAGCASPTEKGTANAAPRGFQIVIDCLTGLPAHRLRSVLRSGDCPSSLPPHRSGRGIPFSARSSAPSYRCCRRNGRSFRRSRRPRCHPPA